MIDYVSLMLLNMAAALVLIGVFVLTAIGRADNKGWAVPFAAAGFVAVVTGFVMTFTWPLPSPYNIAYGEMTVLLGVLLLGAGVAIAKGWDLFPLCYYALFAGLAAILIGIRFIDLGLTRTPLLSGVGFILTGLCGAILLFAAAAILDLGLHLVNKNKYTCGQEVLIILSFVF